MGFVKFIVIMAVLIGVGIWGYMAAQNLKVKSDEHAGHDHSANAEVGDGHEGETAEEHAGHTEDESADAHGEQLIELTPTEIREIGLETAVAKGGAVNTYVSLVGEIRVNEDQMAHVVPRVEGVVREVKKKLGDKVKTGETIAIIESRELADAKAGYLAAFERYQMAKLSFDREEKLWEEKISSEEEYLSKKQALTEAGIEKRTTEQKLHAIGFDPAALKKLYNEPEQLLTRFAIKAPFAGTIIEKHIVLGELVGTEMEVYVVADLSSVWVDLQIYPKDIRSVKKGQKVVISADSEMPDARGIISYVGPIVRTESRTALARVELSNKSGVFRPGLFVTAKVGVSEKKAKVVVIKNAVQSLEGKKCVFVKDAHGFEPWFVEVGLVSGEYVEIVSGLSAGQEYVTKGAFTLKSKIVTSTLDSHAGHGH